MPEIKIIKCYLAFYPTILQVHLEKILTKDRLEEFHGEECTCPFDLNQPAIVKNLFRINGIDEIGLGRYMIYISKGEVFEWPALIVPIFSALLSSLAEDPFSAVIQQVKPPKEYYLDISNKWYIRQPKFDIPNPYRLPERKDQKKN